MFRLQSAGTPAMLQFPEEKQMLSVAVPTRQPVVPEVSTHLISVTGLTESSSSSKLILTVAFHMPVPSLFYFFRCIENPMDCIVTPLCPSVSKTKSLSIYLYISRTVEAIFVR